MNTNISKEQIYVGIDVAKDSLAVCISSNGKHLVCPNQPKELRKLARQLKKLEPHLIVLEATGGYETPAVIAFSEAGLPFAIAFPKRVRQFALGIGIIAKTDEVDARILARYGEVAKLQAKPLQSVELQALQALANRRRQLIEIRMAEQHRLGTCHPSIRKDIKNLISYLDRDINRLDEEIHSLIQKSEAWKQADEILQSVPGVGPVLSITLITGLPELGHLSNKEIAALAGVAPFPRQSGKWNGRRFCKGGRNSVRRVLYMAAIAATRYNPVIKEFYNTLCEKGKLKKVAIIACARKLLVTLNAMIKNNSSWRYHVNPISA